jgi:hypothetical protein
VYKRCLRKYSGLTVSKQLFVIHSTTEGQINLTHTETVKIPPEHCDLRHFPPQRHVHFQIRCWPSICRLFKFTVNMKKASRLKRNRKRKYLGHEMYLNKITKRPSQPREAIPLIHACPDCLSKDLFG